MYNKFQQFEPTVYVDTRSERHNVAQYKLFNYSKIKLTVK